MSKDLVSASLSHLMPKAEDVVEVPVKIKSKSDDLIIDVNLLRGPAFKGRLLSMSIERGLTKFVKLRISIDDAKHFMQHRVIESVLCDGKVLLNSSLGALGCQLSRKNSRTYDLQISARLNNMDGDS